MSLYIVFMYMHSPVSQYFQRLFLLDLQIKHLDQKSLESLGNWLRRRWFYCQEKKHVASAELEQLDVPMVQLRSEWAAQLKEQTKPAPRTFYSMSAGTKP